MVTIQDVAALLRLWYHENCRVFQDRLVNDEDRDWFTNLCMQKMKEDFDQDFSEVVTQTPLLYGDFMTGDAGNYDEITDHTKVRLELVCIVCKYNWRSS